MTEPFAAQPGPANRRALGPPGLLRWPSRIPLNQRADARPEPLPDPGGALDGGRIELPDAVPQGFHPRTAAGEPDAEAGAAPPARRGISVPSARQEPVAKSAAEPESRPLGRPGPPALAGAAIAGLLLVVAPLALSALQRPETLATVPVTAGVGLRAEGPESGGSGTGGGQQESQTSAGGESLSGGAPADPQPESGYVPEAAPQEESGTAGGGGQAQGQSQGESQGDGTGGQNGDAAVSGSEGGGTADGAPQNTTGAEADKQSDAQGGENGGDATGGGSKTESDGESSGNGDSAGGGTGDGSSGENGGGSEGGAPAGDPGDGAAAPMMAGASPSGEPSGGPSPSPSASSSAPAFTALAGPGCAGGEGASYGTAGRGENAPRWATRDGGYALDGCDGSYDAIPVSGTAEYGDGRFAYWSFSPGFTDAECDIFVFVPEDESPKWVTDREAMYQIFPGPEPTGSAAAVFGVQQSESKGGWVKVTGFVSPSEQFTVQLTNIGENAVAGQDGATSHVAASAVKTTCT